MRPPERLSAEAADAPELSREQLGASLSALVRTPSVNPGMSELAMVEEIERQLEGSGCELTRVESMPGRPSLAAVLDGSGDGPRLVLNGHMDTVAIDDPARWSVDPFGGEITRWGRLGPRLGRHEGRPRLADRLRQSARQGARPAPRLAGAPLRGRGGVWRARHALSDRGRLCGRLGNHHRANGARDRDRRARDGVVRDHDHGPIHACRHPPGGRQPDPCGGGCARAGSPLQRRPLGADASSPGQPDLHRDHGPGRRGAQRHSGFVQAHRGQARDSG